MIMHQLQNFDKHIYIFICKMTKGKNEPSTYDISIKFIPIMFLFLMILHKIVSNNHPMSISSSKYLMI